MKRATPYSVQSITEIHRQLGLPSPRHPLVSFFRFDQMSVENRDVPELYSAPTEYRNTMN